MGSYRVFVEFAINEHFDYEACSLAEALSIVGNMTIQELKEHCNINVEVDDADPWIDEYEYTDEWDCEDEEDDIIPDDEVAPDAYDRYKNGDMDGLEFLEGDE